MIAADTSSIVAYLNGETGRDVERLNTATLAGEVALPPIVVTELLSDPAEGERAERELLRFGLLPLTAGYWNRAGATRRTLTKRGLKAKLGDALIAQACIDNDVALITRDADFRHFAKHCGLKLA
jgi:predicted nucleic acid-binding protein